MKRLVLLSMTMIMLIFSTSIWAAGVFEEFESGPGDFVEGNGFSASGGKFTFTGNGNNTTSFVEWSGGLNPGEWNPVPGNTNYFSDFGVSVDVTWLNGSEDAGYGLSVCNQENASGTADYIRFFIYAVGSNTAYKITAVQDGNSQTLVDLTPSDAIRNNSTNELFIFKSGNYLAFSINDTEVEELEIDGCSGGSVGLEVSNLANVTFDNFKLLPFFYEDFSGGMGGFSSKDFFSVSDEQLHFNGDGSDDLQSLPWDGGYNPGGWNPSPGHSNYFENFSVSIDTFWAGASELGGYGLSVCNHENSSGSPDYVIFIIAGDGSYTVSTVINDVYEKPVDWTSSSLINANGSGSNELSINKEDNQFSFSINGTDVEQLEIDGCVGGSVNLEVSKNVNMTFDNFFLMDLPPTKKANSDPTLPPPISVVNQRPVANFSVTPPSGKAPLTVTLDASVLSKDADGTITTYQWNSSDGQTANGSVTSITFGTVGTYTITLLVTDDKGASSNPLDRTVTVVADDATPPPTPPVDEGDLVLAFEGLEEFYKVGAKVSIDLVQKIQRSRFERVDLWVAVKLPGGDFLFWTGIPLAPFSPQPQPFKESIESLDDRVRLLADFEVSPGLGGDYTFYAAFVEEGMNPVSNGLAIQKIIQGETTLAN